MALSQAGWRNAACQARAAISRSALFASTLVIRFRYSGEKNVFFTGRTFSITFAARSSIHSFSPRLREVPRIAQAELVVRGGEPLRALRDRHRGEHLLRPLHVPLHPISGVELAERNAPAPGVAHQLDR